MEDNLWQIIADFLIEKGIDVYPPGTHVGDCISNYIVILPSGSSQAYTFSSQFIYYDILIYSPEKSFTDFLKFEKEVKEAIKDLYPTIIPTGDETGVFPDDTNNSFTKTVSYRASVRNNHL